MVPFLLSLSLFPSEVKREPPKRHAATEQGNGAPLGQRGEHQPPRAGLVLIEGRAHAGLDG